MRLVNVRTLVLGTTLLQTDADPYSSLARPRMLEPVGEDEESFVNSAWRFERFEAELKLQEGSSYPRPLRVSGWLTGTGGFFSNCWGPCSGDFCLTEKLCCSGDSRSASQCFDGRYFTKELCCDPDLSSAGNSPDNMLMRHEAILGIEQQYQRLNMRQLEHLATLGLPLAGRSVLELGARSGQLTSFFTDRGCKVTVVEPRHGNLLLLRKKLAKRLMFPDPSRVTLLSMDLEKDMPAGRYLSIRSDKEFLDRLAAQVGDILILETVVAWNSSYWSDEDPRALSMGLASRVQRLSRRAIFEILKSRFPLHDVIPIFPFCVAPALFVFEGSSALMQVAHVAYSPSLRHTYVPRSQPSHSSYPTDWGSEESNREGFGERRALGGRSGVSVYRVSGGHWAFFGGDPLVVALVCRSPSGAEFERSRVMVENEALLQQFNQRTSFTPHKFCQPSVRRSFGSFNSALSFRIARMRQLAFFHGSIRTRIRQEVRIVDDPGFSIGESEGRRLTSPVPPWTWTWTLTCLRGVLHVMQAFMIAHAVAVANASGRSRLVIDVGANFGQSSERYLALGYRVVAVEPNPVAAKAIRQRLSHYLKSGQLYVEEGAVWTSTSSGALVTLYVNEEDSEWSSLIRSCGERYDTEASEVEVKATTLEALVQTYGAPWYIKIDTEGADGIILRQIGNLTPKPPYMSFELNSLAWLDEAHALGYDAFKVVPQACHKADGLLDKQGRPLTHAGAFGEDVAGAAGDGGWRTRGETIADCRRLCLVHDADAEVEDFAAGPPRFVDRDFATLRACFQIESKSDEEWYDIHCRHSSRSVETLSSKEASTEL
ncbi:unnamed protein product [Polarella glacialis]|uniref:Methyltransferase FkbM domain-containing protein n=1 Tax=Polarella glacialis TaxID=89957 RepID=A0A813KVK7_POLGL|nr:unnamed protein product [Polarella glacialis]